MVQLVRHDLMTVDPEYNILVDMESGAPLFIDFGRGETIGSIYTTRIKTFMKKILQLLVRTHNKRSMDVAARFLRALEETVKEELINWQDEKTRDQKEAVAIVGDRTKWQEGVEEVRSIWNDAEEC